MCACVCLYVCVFECLYVYVFECSPAPHATHRYNTFSVFITLNFLVVIILGKFAMTEDEKTRRRKERSDLEIARHHKKRRFYSESFRHRYVLESPMDTLGVDDVAKAYAPAASPVAGDGDAEPSSSRRRRGRSAREAFAGSVRSLVRSSRNLRMSPDCRQRCWHSMMTSGMTGACVRAVRKDKTLMVFGPTNRLRLFLDKLVKSPWFERVIMLCIVVSSLTLTLESPKYDSDMLKDVLYWSDTVFLVIFCLEFIVKAIALGFMFGKYAYLQDAWNRLDFFVVIVTLASRLSGGSGAGRTLRVGRILRPLRMINRNEGMKVVINALLRSLPAVGYTVVLLVLFFFIFGILGINLFSGKFYSCSDATVRFKFECVGTYVLPNGIAVPRVWANPDFSFDNIGAAALTLLEVVALRGWVPVLNAAMDVTEVDQQPEKLNSPGSALYVSVVVGLGGAAEEPVFLTLHHVARSQVLHCVRVHRRVLHDAPVCGHHCVPLPPVLWHRAPHGCASAVAGHEAVHHNAEAGGRPATPLQMLAFVVWHCWPRNRATHRVPRLVRARGHLGHPVAPVLPGDTERGPGAVVDGHAGAGALGVCLCVRSGAAPAHVRRRCHWIHRPRHALEPV